jgi:hypothetical protein
MPFEPEITAQLRTRRNDIQHGAGIPSSIDLRRFQAWVRAFAEHVFNKILGVKFESLAVTGLIADEVYRSRFEAVEKQAQAGDHAMAAMNCLGFVEILIDKLSQHLLDTNDEDNTAENSTSLMEKLGEEISKGVADADFEGSIGYNIERFASDAGASIWYEIKEVRLLATMTTLGFNAYQFNHLKRLAPRYYVDKGEVVMMRNQKLEAITTTPAQYEKILDFTIDIIMRAEELLAPLERV